MQPKNVMYIKYHIDTMERVYNIVYFSQQTHSPWVPCNEYGTEWKIADYKLPDISTQLTTGDSANLRVTVRNT